MARIVSTKPLSMAQREKLARFGDVACPPEDRRFSQAELFAALQDAVGLITFGTRVDETLLEQAPSLKVASTASVGYDHFDLAAMRRRHILGAHTPHVLDDTVADLGMALMLAVARRIVELDGYVRGGEWKKGDEEALYGVDVHHRTLGIVGMGRIGRALAKRAKFGFSMNILYHARSRHDDVEQAFGARYADLPDLLHESDFVVLLTPLTPDTENLMNEERFRRMKPSAIFINLSRGKTVDEDALVQALREGWIRGAGLDVYRQEPVPSDHPLLSLSNVVCVPHIGSATQATRTAMLDLAIDNLIAVLDGRTKDAYIVPELRDLAQEG
ncbi:D-glycerate dehydrogenase [Alicyclobacillus mali]|uniref:D-glycerate dehydrogenase n=1 Tax=Alicyclobacillus mali (ex Roth et al. 2021) TaxID=1123961 RepID=A0ABS0F6H6_9BACL|nr:D-glycerate dehydrogenase [Alicyclobacillus mali (ex Roth et al. 2021)]MBF8378894.1 D-glycerate dehydrogenase [Alicyclobacillus mali (ex Roth et al. 2021)]